MFALRFFANRFFLNRFFPHIGAAAAPATNGILVVDNRRLPVFFMQVARPVMDDAATCAMQSDDRHLKPSFTGVSAPVFYQ